MSDFQYSFVFAGNLPAWKKMHFSGNATRIRGLNATNQSNVQCGLFVGRTPPSLPDYQIPAYSTLAQPIAGATSVWIAFSPPMGAAPVGSLYVVITTEIVVSSSSLLVATSANSATYDLSTYDGANYS